MQRPRRDPSCNRFFPNVRDGQFVTVVARRTSYLVPAFGLWRGYLVATGTLASSCASSFKSNCRWTSSLARASCLLKIVRFSQCTNSSMASSFQGSLARVGDFRSWPASQIDLRGILELHVMHAYKSGGNVTALSVTDGCR